MKAERPANSQVTSALEMLPDQEGGLELGQFVAAIRRKAFLVAGVTTVVAALAQLKALTDVPVYTGGFEILTKAVTVETEVISSVPQTLTSRQQDNTTAALDATKIRVLQSPSLLYPIVEELREDYPQFNYGTLAGSLQIQTDGSDILNVSFTNENAELVKEVLDLVSQAYLNYSLEDRQRDVRQGIKFVEEQLPRLEERVEEQQEKLQEFRQRYNLIDPQIQAQRVSEQSGALLQQQLTTRTQLNEAQLLYRHLQDELQQPSAELAAASALTNSPRFQKLLDQLLEIDSKLAQSSALYRENSPEIELLQDQRQRLLPLLQFEGVRVQRQVASQIEELEDRDRAVSQSISILNQQIRQLSVITREYTDIQRELQIATDNLNQFLAKREGLRIDAAQRQVPWQLLTPPGDLVPSSASLKRNLVLGVILGLLLGVGSALVVDRLSNIIHTSKEIKDITKLPLLGVIPFEKHLDRLIAMQQATRLLKSAETQLEFVQSDNSDFAPFTPFQEAFRSLHTNLQLLNPDEPIRSVVITSATPSNGKTTVALNLAQAAAAMGRRVLLVDADLRRPQLHRYLGISGAKGVTEMVSMNLDLLDGVYPVDWEPNLFVLPCGVIPPDPTRILSSQAMKRLMETAYEKFDLVIYDLPPMLGFADANLMASRADALLLVVRLHQLKRTFLEQTIDQLRVSKVPVAGIIANASEEQSLNLQGYYQHYAEAWEEEEDDDFADMPSSYSQGPSAWLRKLGHRNR